MRNKILTKSQIEKSKKNRRRLIVGLLVVIIAIGAYTSVYYKPQTSKSADSETTKNYLSLLGSDMPEVAYTLTSEKFQSEMPVEDYVLMAKLQGELKDVSIDNVAGSGNFKTVSGKLTMADGNVKANYALDIVEENGVWKVNRSEIRPAN